MDDENSIAFAKLTVIVHEVSDGDAEQGTLKSSEQAGNALARDNLPHSLDGVGVGFLGLDLRSGRQRDQGISAFSLSIVIYSVRWGVTDVRAMDSRPPPAPARAWATLSLCCAATAWTVALCACSSCAWAAAGRGFEEVGAATLSDMMNGYDDMMGLGGTRGCNSGLVRC